VKNLIKFLCVALLAIVAMPCDSQAVLYGFYNISANNPDDAAIGEAQLSVDVLWNEVDGLVEFTFANSGPYASSITDVYFMDGTLLALAEIDEGGGGVDFSQYASPGDLPDGQEVGFAATQGFSADSNPPVEANGVNPGEWLTIGFILQGGQTYQSVLDDLDDGDLRIGIHVQGFASGGSESFVTSGSAPAPVPEPATMLLLGSGLLGLSSFRKRLKS